MSFAQILSSVDEQRKRKLAAKLPEYAELGINIPSSLALEQCSSNASADYKAELATRFVGKLGKVIDITGGLGIDSFAFAKRSDSLYYYERNAELVEAVRRNAELIGVENIEFHCEEIGANSDLPRVDLIYADPARRDLAGKKVFKLEDCSPNILELLPRLFESSDCIMLKLSPMADITVLRAGFGEYLSEVHIVGLGNEVKELLCLLRKDYCPETKVVGTRIEFEDSFEFYLSEKAEAVYAESIEIGDILLDPCAVLRKTGAFNLIAQRFGIEKLDVSTQLYRSSKALDSKLFRQYKIMETLPFGKSAFKQIASKYPQADVTAYNIPLSSVELAKRLGVRSGGEVHIFGFASACQGRLLAVCKSV